MIQHLGRLKTTAAARIAPLVLTSALLAAPTCWAAPENITDGELALLPPYCQDVQAIRWGNASYNPSPRAAYWVSLMGQPFWALHHYCWGLIHVRRSEAPGLAPMMRAGMLNSAINDYFYVINNAPRDFVLAPEIYLRIGEARLSVGQIGLAHDAFRIARELKPDYWPAYTRWIDHLLRTNQRAAAKDMAAEGLRVIPDSVELQERYRRLGGDPSKIEPIMAQVPTPSKAPGVAANDAPAEKPTTPKAESDIASTPGASQVVTDRR